MSKRLQVSVTDHAVLRYLERVKGFDVEAVRRHIVDMCDGPAAVGAVVVNAEGVKFEIRGNVVVTITPKGQVPCATSQKQSKERAARRAPKPAAEDEFT